MTDAREDFQPIEAVIIDRHALNRAADIMERISRYIHFDVDAYILSKAQEKRKKK